MPQSLSIVPNFDRVFVESIIEQMTLGFTMFRDIWDFSRNHLQAGQEEPI
jgi:hypothetical protein